MNRRSISCKVCIYFHGKLKNLIFSIFFIENSRWKYFWCLEIFSSSKTLKNFISFRFFFSFYHLFFIFQHFMGFDCIWMFCVHACSHLMPQLSFFYMTFSQEIVCELQIRWNLAHSFIEPFQKVSNVQKNFLNRFIKVLNYRKSIVIHGKCLPLP